MTLRLETASFMISPATSRTPIPALDQNLERRGRLFGLLARQNATPILWLSHMFSGSEPLMGARPEPLNPVAGSRQRQLIAASFRSAETIPAPRDFHQHSANNDFSTKSPKTQILFRFCHFNHSPCSSECAD